jgi:hypothetical protein
MEDMSYGLVVVMITTLLNTREPKNIIMNGLSKDMMMCIY